MKFQLDTEDMENIKLTFSDEDLENELSENIQDFCYGMAAFFVDFAQKIGCDTKKALELKDLCFSCAGNDVEALLHAGILDEEEENEDNEEYKELRKKMKEAGFSEEDIAGAIRLAQACGGLEAATDYLDGVIKEANGISPKE